MNILFVDHECHRKTHSADFILDLLREVGEVRSLYYPETYRFKVPQRDRDWADVVVIWEFLLSRYSLGCPGKPCVFVPMYDNEWGSRWQWRRIAWSGMGVLSFCANLSNHARKCGVRNILDVRYFPDPGDFPQTPGNPRRVFLWERGEIDRNIAEVLFPPSDGYVLDVKKRNEFLDRGEYLERISKCGAVVAPRRKEGIGMACLEAMAMGKCVVANNDATMNEYITHGRNGLLFSCNAPHRISLDDIVHVSSNIGKDAMRMRRAWEENAKMIPRFILSQSCAKPTLLRRILIALTYPLFLAEGAIFRIKNG